MFAVHFREDRACDYVGEVFSETSDHVRIQVCDAFMLVGAGLWQLSDEVVDVDRSECRFFLTEAAAAEACATANAHIRS